MPTNQRLAQLKAGEIEKDILYERFDPTLEKYKSQSALSTATQSDFDRTAENFAVRFVGKVHRV